MYAPRHRCGRPCVCVFTLCPDDRRRPASEEGGMRVLVNTLTVEGPRTGIGHYTSELVRALRAAEGDGAVGTFPGGVLRRARAAWARARQGAPSSSSAATNAGWAGRLRQAVRGR